MGICTHSITLETGSQGLLHLGTMPSEGMSSLVAIKEEVVEELCAISLLFGATYDTSYSCSWSIGSNYGEMEDVAELVACLLRVMVFTPVFQF